MLKVMNLLILTLSMYILMSISSNAEVTKADKKRCSGIFNDLDWDKNGNITVEDVNSFFSDAKNLKEYDGMILNKEKFKEALINKTRDGAMDLEAFVEYLYGGKSFEELRTMVEEIFPVQREEILEEDDVFKMLKRDDLKQNYTIEELTQFIFYNHELFE